MHAMPNIASVDVVSGIKTSTYWDLCCCPDRACSDAEINYTVTIDASTPYSRKFGEKLYGKILEEQRQAQPHELLAVHQKAKAIAIADARLRLKVLLVAIPLLVSVGCIAGWYSNLKETRIYDDPDHPRPDYAHPLNVTLSILGGSLLLLGIASCFRYCCLGVVCCKKEPEQQSLIRV